MAKRLESRYFPGRRSRDWLKIKNVRSQEMVIGGWLPGEGSRAGKIGALLVGHWDKEGESPRLRYAGRVGTGFDDRDLKLLADELEALRREDSPFSGRQPPKHSIFVEPELVAEVAFSEWTERRHAATAVLQGPARRCLGGRRGSRAARLSAI